MHTGKVPAEDDDDLPDEVTEDKVLSGFRPGDPTVEVLHNNVDRIVAHASTAIRARVVQYSSVSKEELNASLTLIVRSFAEILEVGHPGPLMKTLETVIVARIQQGLTLGSFVTAALQVNKSVQSVVRQAGLPTELVEEAMYVMVANASNAFSDAYRTRLAQLEQGQADAAAKAARLQGISDMVTGIAHELNTPLGIVRSTADILGETLSPAGIASLQGDPEASADLQQALGLIRTHVDRASKLVDRFKTLSVRHVVDHPEDVPLTQLVDEVVATWRAHSADTELEVVVVDETEGRANTFRGYPGHLTQVLLHLLANAERYAYGPAGGVARIRARCAGSEVTLVVEDDGVGIAPEVLPRLFDPFFTTDRGRGGSGLGLAVVHTLIHGPMQGQIAVTSTVGKGATFTIRLPLRC